LHYRFGGKETTLQFMHGWNDNMKWIWKKSFGGTWTEFIWFRGGTVSGIW